MGSMAMARAVLARTNKITTRTGVTAPILRYHPATVVQLLPVCIYLKCAYCYLRLALIKVIDNVITTSNN